MARPKKKEEDRRIGISFRLPAEVIAILKSKSGSAGLTRTDFVDRAIRGSVVVVSKDEVAIDRSKVERAERLRMLRYLSATSNNANQMAHRLHLDHFENKVSEDTYIALLKQMSYLIDLMKQAV